jgi:hypothetical protein
MKSILMFFGLLLCTDKVFSQNLAELSCRAKAKETAALTYSSCVTEARNTRVDEIRSHYQKELAALKLKYDRELETMGKVGPKSNSKNSEAFLMSSKNGKTDTIRKSPVKTTLRSRETPPSRPVRDEVKVIAVDTEKISDGNDDSNPSENNESNSESAAD